MVLLLEAWGGAQGHVCRLRGTEGHSVNVTPHPSGHVRTLWGPSGGHPHSGVAAI